MIIKMELSLCTEVRNLTQELSFTESNIINWLRLILDIYPADSKIANKVERILDRAERRKNGRHS
jgi:hypothetical protein